MFVQGPAVPVSVTLFENCIFLNVYGSQNIIMLDFKWTTNAYTAVPGGKGRGKPDTYRKAKGRCGVMPAQAKKCQNHQRLDSSNELFSPGALGMA